MKKLGMVRKIDELGRITLPMELRRTFGIEEKDPLEIYVEGDVICLKQVKDETVKECAICGSTEALISVDGKHICRMHAFAVVDQIMEK